MNRQTIILRILFVLFICSPFYFHVCFAQANGDSNDPTFELELEPADPQAWLGWRPEYQTNALFTAIIKGKTADGQAITAFRNVEFTFDLGTPSKLKGVCMNFNGKEEGDADGDGTANEDIDTAASSDLFFRRKDNASGSGYLYTVTDPIAVPGEKPNGSGEVEIGLGLTETNGNNSSVLVSVRVNDYGAFGILSASATFNYKDPLSGSFTPSDSADNEISIPWDNNSNDIADGWDPESDESETYDETSSTLDKNANYLPWDDTETGPGNNIYTGDGFTVFEEYRGFYVKGKHTTIDPTDKDLFIFSEMDEGIGDASGLPAPIVKHEINFNEAYRLPNPDPKALSTVAPGSEDPWVNFNSCGGLKTFLEQNALWVDKDSKIDTLPTLFGEVKPPVPGPVHAMEVIKIYEEAIQDAESATESERIRLGESYAAKVPSTTNYRVSKLISLVIGHEIGHAVGLFHPFEPIYSSERPDIARPRYHDRVRYNITYCQYEKDPDKPNEHNLYRAPSLRHGPHARCGSSPLSVWDSGSTIMDYGSETAIIGYLGSSGNRYDITSASILAMYEQSSSYLARLHNVEYLFVSKSVAEAHKNAPKPDLQKFPKPQWSPPDDDGTSSNQSTLTSSDDVYTCTAGSSHTSNCVAPAAYTSVKWYVKPPADTSDRGSLVETDTGDGSATMASLSYTFAADAVSGAYVITAYVTTSSGTYEVSYTVTLSTVPGSPSISSATPSGDTSVVVSWSAPTSDGGSAILDYEYRYKVSGATEEGTWTSAGTDTSETITGLTAGTSYEFVVRSKNAVGYSDPSAAFTFTTLGTAPSPPTVPSAPRNLTVSGVDRTTVYLDWDAPVDDGGRAITSYRYHIDTKNDGSWEELGTLNSISTSVNLYRFTPGETYAFMISAVNPIGASTTSNKAVITMQSITAPSAPQDLAAVAGNASVYLSWSYPADDGGGTINYQYRYRQNSGTWSSWSTEQWQTSVTITSLTNGTTYDFEVVATNESGAGTAATVSATPTNTAVPGVPAYFSTASDNGAVDLYWDPPAYNGGTPITDYEYRYRQSGGSWNDWASAGNANVELPEYLVTGLTNGTTYQFQVRARNAVGTGPSTETLSETPKAKKPDVPTGVSAAAGSTTGSIVLTWTAPDANGSPITDYKVAYCKYDNGWKKWTDYTSTGSTSTSYTVTGLETGEVYRFRVRAVNGVGESRTSRVAQTTAP